MSSRSNTRGAATLTASVLLAVLGGCTTGGPILTGATSTTLGSNTSTATPTPTPTATPVPTATPTPTPAPTPIPGGTGVVTIAEGQLALDGGYIVVFSPFTLSGGGSLDFVADWLSPLDDIDIGITSGECTVAMMQTSSCTFLAVADSATNKPEEIVLPVSAGTYTPVLGNFTVSTEVISYRVVYTPSATASAAERSAMATRMAAELKGGLGIQRIRGTLKR